MAAVVLHSSEISGKLQPSENETARIRELKQRELDSAFLGVTSTAWKVWSLVTLSTFFSTAGLTITALGILGYIVSPWALPIAICSLVIGAVLFVIYGLSYHYESARYLMSYRETALQRYETLCEALQMDEPLCNELLRKEASELLEAIAGEHGWRNMFYYGIPFPSDFERMFLFQIQHMELTRALSFYDLVSSEYEKAVCHYGDDIFEYTIPEPTEWGSWAEEVQNCPVDRLFEIYDIEHIATYGLIDNDELVFLRNLKKDFEIYKKRWKEASQEVEPNYQSKIAPFREERDEKLAAAQEAFKTHAAHKELRDLMGKQVKERAQLRANLERVLRPFEEELSFAEKSVGDYWERRAGDIRKKMEGLEASWRQSDTSLMDRYGVFRKDFLEQLHLEKMRCDRAISKAEKQFVQATASIKLEHDDLLRDPLKAYLDGVEGLGRRYDNAFRIARIRS